MTILAWTIAALSLLAAVWMWRWARGVRQQLVRSRVAQQIEAERSGTRYTALEAEHDRLRTILAALDDAVVIVGPTEEVRSVNDAALALFPTSFVTVRGRRVIEMTGDHEIAALVRQCLKTRARREGRVELASTGRIIRVIAVPVDDGEGNALLLARDVTEMQHLQTVRRELVANVSHELRTPLGIVRLYIETLLDGGLDVPGMAEDRLNKMLHEVDELTQLVNELLQLSRLESGREQPRLVPLDVRAVVADATARLDVQAERAGVSLDVELPSQLPTVIGDRRMLEGALVNLIHNAVKFTPPGGMVAVGATLADDQRLDLWVRDTGIGIGSEHLPRLFERFYKEDRARSGKGTGLGLAIVKHVALAHGGAVGVESTLGTGSRFILTLPTATAHRRLDLASD